jgi:hypothetical protein
MLLFHRRNRMLTKGAALCRDGFSPLRAMIGLPYKSLAQEHGFKKGLPSNPTSPAAMSSGSHQGPLIAARATRGTKPLTAWDAIL